MGADEIMRPTIVFLNACDQRLACLAAQAIP